LEIVKIRFLKVNKILELRRYFKIKYYGKLKRIGIGVSRGENSVFINPRITKSKCAILRENCFIANTYAEVTVSSIGRRDAG